MKTKFVGIDLGTTNSAIASYDGVQTRIWKSPEQTDVTPSAIYVGKRGNRYYGKRAYDRSPFYPGHVAMLFKRLMGTSTPVKLPAVDLTLTPEECSAEILKVLFGYLPEELREDPDLGTVITVPAAFNQMQKDATMQAASAAQLGKVALMQEPVAAVMSVMRHREVEGIFMIYDLGGGTLDIAIAESIGGRISLHEHGGMSFFGGRDLDRAIFDSIVRPWLLENFRLPENLAVNRDFESLRRMALFAAEQAKIELSAKESAIIHLSEDDIKVRDGQGEDIYLDIPLTREMYQPLLEARVRESVEFARQTLEKAGLKPEDVERIVFVGGPTMYKPLRDLVSFELGIAASTEVNPMTAVSEGASVFAESIDWDSKSRGRRSSRGQLKVSLDQTLSFNFIARTPDVRSKIAVQLSEELDPGTEFQIDSLDTGWSSGRLPLKKGSIVEVSLSKMGDNAFKVFVFDGAGRVLPLAEDKIVITRTAATVDAIPASHSIGIEALEKLGGQSTLSYLVRAGDPLPVKGRLAFKAAETLKAGSPSSLNFKLWEGEIEDRISDNRPIGVMKISGSDFDDGVIPAGTELICEYEVLDSGNVIISISVPFLGATFDEKNFYSRQEGQVDFSSDTSFVVDEGEKVKGRLEEVEKVVDDPKLERIRSRVERATELEAEGADPERAQDAMEAIQEAKTLLAEVRKEHLKEIRRIDLDATVAMFNDFLRQFARPSEVSAFENLVRTAERAIGEPGGAFEHHHQELQRINFEILFRQDFFIVERFKWCARSPHLFSSRQRYLELIELGNQCLRNDDMDKLREVVVHLSGLQIRGPSELDLLESVNIVRG